MTTQYAVEIMDLVKRTLPVVTMAMKCLWQSSTEEPGVYSDTKHMHYATVETDHPYKPASVAYFKVRPSVPPLPPSISPPSLSHSLPPLSPGEVLRGSAVDESGV